jgi:hypothetical protein
MIYDGRMLRKEGYNAWKHLRIHLLPTSLAAPQTTPPTCHFLGHSPSSSPGLALCEAAMASYMFWCHCMAPRPTGVCRKTPMHVHSIQHTSLTRGAPELIPGAATPQHSLIYDVMDN